MPTVLIVDDCELNRCIFTRRLTRQGFDVIEAQEGAEALDLIREKHPDLALVDLLMPGVDGFEFVQQLRQLEEGVARTPVVFITAAYLPENVLKLARMCGVTQVLSKEATPDEIALALNRAIEAERPSAVAAPKDEFSVGLLKLVSSTLVDHLKSFVPSIVGNPGRQEPPAPNKT